MPRSPSAGPPRSHLPRVIYVLTAGTFLMGTSEFVVAGLLPEIATDFATSVGRAGLSITVFAIGMIIGAPSMALLTLRLPRRLTLTLALVVFALGHVLAALTDGFVVLLAARCVTAFATGAFWAVAAVVAGRAAGPAASSRALGIVLGGGMLANVLGVPIGALAGQLLGWRGPFWALAALALGLAVAVARLVPHDEPHQQAPSIRRELAGLRSGRLWLVLATCAAVNAGVLSVYSFIAPLATERAGLASSLVPLALVLFGAGALVGSVVGGRVGDRHPLRLPLATASISLAASVGLCLFSTSPGATLALFAVLGLVGLSANPVLVNLAVGYGAAAPTLASAMATSMFNLGTALGTWVTGLALATSVGTLAPPLVGVAAGALVFVPLGALALTERRRAATLEPPPDPGRRALTRADPFHPQHPSRER